MNTLLTLLAVVLSNSDSIVRSLPSTDLPLTTLIVSTDCPGAEIITVEPPNSPGQPSGVFEPETVVTISREDTGCGFLLSWSVNGLALPLVDQVRILALGGNVITYQIHSDCDCGIDNIHSADTNGDWHIELNELMRIIEFFNAGGFHCDSSTEDGYAPGPGTVPCIPSSSDYSPQDWKISLGELLRAIQFYHATYYVPCYNAEDGFCPVYPSK